MKYSQTAINRLVQEADKFSRINGYMNTLSQTGSLDVLINVCLQICDNFRKTSIVDLMKRSYSEKQMQGIDNHVLGVGTSIDLTGIENKQLAHYVEFKENLKLICGLVIDDVFKYFDSFQARQKIANQQKLNPQGKDPCLLTSKKSQDHVKRHRGIGEVSIDQRVMMNAINTSKVKRMSLNDDLIEPCTDKKKPPSKSKAYCLQNMQTTAQSKQKLREDSDTKLHVSLPSSSIKRKTQSRIQQNNQKPKKSNPVLKKKAFLTIGSPIDSKGTERQSRQNSKEDEQVMLRNIAEFENVKDSVFRALSQGKSDFQKMSTDVNEYKISKNDCKVNPRNVQIKAFHAEDDQQDQACESVEEEEEESLYGVGESFPLTERVLTTGQAKPIDKTNLNLTKSLEFLKGLAETNIQSKTSPNDSSSQFHPKIQSPPQSLSKENEEIKNLKCNQAAMNSIKRNLGDSSSKKQSRNSDLAGSSIKSRSAFDHSSQRTGVTSAIYGGHLKQFLISPKMPVKHVQNHNQPPCTRSSAALSSKFGPNNYKVASFKHRNSALTYTTLSQQQHAQQQAK